MKVSVNWLKQYVEVNCDANQLADALTTAGLEVEGIESVASGTNLTVGLVKECIDHPDSDHLHVCQVDIGYEVTQIVCGAPNVAAGQKVIVAKPGAVLPDGTIKSGSIRGQVSNGMICSLSELGVDKKMLSEAQLAGIEILNDDAVVGCDNVLEYLGLDDVILDVKQTPNRADFMSMWSVAKEVGAILNSKVTIPECKGVSNIGSATDLKIVSKTDKCPVFLGKIIGSLKVGPSPKWMVDALHGSGVKSINNVVDISNYVMLETGQPLHFYDLAKVPAKEITVVDDIEMTMTALDGQEYQVFKNDLVITTAGRPTGLAGIMGGDDSKIDEETTGIIIEAAHFNRVNIRNTSRRVGLNTEASSRFTKGLEPQAQIKAMDRAVQLLSELADAQLIEETITVGEINYNLIKVSETLEHCNQLLGTSFTKEQVNDVFTRLDFAPQWEVNTVTCTIPSYRTDIFIREDLDEEIIRLLGYEDLKTTLPTMPATVGELSDRQRMRRNIKQSLTGLGMQEVVTYTLVSDSFTNQAVMPLGKVVSLALPMSEERKNVRNSLIMSMIECLAYNQNHKNDNNNLFEISNVYAENLVEERLGMVFSGSLQASRLNKLEIESDFYTAKGVLLTTLEKLGFGKDRISFKENTIEVERFHPYRSACVYLGKDLLGIMGEIHPTIQKEWGITKAVYAEIKLDQLLNAKASKVKFVPLNKFPAVHRDIAMIVEADLAVEQLAKTIRSAGKLVKDVEVFDIYRGEHVEKGFKSVALSITYQSDDHTLTEQEISQVHESILAKLKNDCQANLRG